MKRKATAVWQGTGKEGNGHLSTQSGVLEKTQYSYLSRFEQGIGTNPEELIAAAHAGCFTMAFSGFLGRAGYEATSIETKAVVHVEKEEAGFSIPRIDLITEAVVPNITDEEFQTVAKDAKEKCPVSRVLAGAEISLSAGA